MSNETQHRFINIKKKPLDSFPESLIAEQQLTDSKLYLCRDKISMVLMIDK